MKRIIFLPVILFVMTTACKSKAPDDPHKSPKDVAETIFYLIDNEKYDGLPDLIDAEADTDGKELGNLKSADGTKQKQAREYFKGAKISGDPVINGDKASVKVKLGHNGAFEETFKMVKKNDKWYLQSF